MKTLHLTLKKKWFDMTLSGEKTEEYREINMYWITRLLNCKKEVFCYGAGMITNPIIHDIELLGLMNLYGRNCNFDSYMKTARKNIYKQFDITHLYNGGSPSVKYPNFIVEQLNISIGEGKPEWGAEPGKLYFVIKHGKIL